MSYYILVVDDERLIGESLCELLDFYGYEMAYACNGKVALDIMEKRSPDPVLTDLMMPVMNGMELLSNIKEKYPETGVIMLTAYASVESSVKALKQGAFDYIIKPYKEEDITQSLNHYFEQKRLQKENITLRKLNEIKDKFLSLASHELNTPLMIITGYLEILKEDGIVLNEYQSCVSGAYNACNRLANIIAGMRYLTYTLSDLNSEKLLLNNWMLELVSAYRPIAEKRNQTIEIEICQENCYINADKDILYQILHHIISNAIKFTPDNGKILVSLNKKDNKKLEIICKDNGDGIPKDEIARIFDTFYTCNPIMNHHTAINYEYRGGGIGNGLAIAKHLTNLLCGEISVESETEKGSSFKLILHEA